MPSTAAKFSAGKPAGVSNITKDVLGRIATWTENGFAMVVTRDAQGKPTQVTGSSLRGNFVWTFNYDASGNLQSHTGAVPTVFYDELVLDAAKSAKGGAAASAVTLSGATTLTNDHMGRVLICSTALTITIPVGLVGGHVRIVPPASGNVSLASDGTATINGATTTITRARAQNAAGFNMVSLGSNATLADGS